MGSRSDSDIDDDFRELYKEYTGPPGSATVNSQDNAKAKKRPHAGSDEEKEPCDPNAVPTDFTSREAKVWEAKSKATERNWKKKKEEEMICKRCGDPGHFTQGCPSTLGANRKSQDFFEQVPARDSHVRALFMGKAMQKIEKDIGCKLRLEEIFLIVSGKDRLILAKGVDAVHKMTKDGGDQKGLSGTCKLRSRSPIRSLVGDKFRSSDSQRSNRCPPNASEYHPRFNKREKGVENHIREDVQRFTKISPPQGSSFGEAYGTDRSRSCSRCSKSPARPLNKGNLYNSYNSRSQSISVQRSDGERRAPGAQSHMLEELEMDYKREVMDLERIRDKEEDEENYRHREAIREIRENYMQKLSIVRSSHARQFEEFVKLDSVRRQLQACEQMSGRGFGGYKQQSFSNYDGAPNLQYAIPMDPRNVPLNPMENYPSRPNGSHGEFQCQTRDGHGKNYGQYKT